MQFGVRAAIENLNHSLATAPRRFQGSRRYQAICTYSVRLDLTAASGEKLNPNGGFGVISTKYFYPVFVFYTVVLSLYTEPRAHPPTHRFPVGGGGNALEDGTPHTLH